MKNRESFVIYKNWVDAINRLPEECQLEIYKSLMEYGLTGKMPDNVSTICSAMLVSFSVSLENSINRYLASIENGKKGGAPKGNQNARKKSVCLEEDNDNQLVALEEDNEENEKQPNDLEKNNSKQPNITQGDNLKQPKTTQNNLKQPKTSENNLYDYDYYYEDLYLCDKKENSLTRVKESEKNSLSPARKKEKHKYGQFKNVLLTEDEYNSLLLKPDGKEAIEYLSYHREMKGYKCKDDNLAIQKWVFDAIKEQRQRKARLESSGLQKSNGLQKESPMTQLGRIFHRDTSLSGELTSKDGQSKYPPFFPSP